MSDAAQVDQPDSDEERACRNCIYWRNPKDGNGYCFVAPPNIILVTVAEPAKSKLLNAQEMPQYSQVPGSTRPITQAADICAQHCFAVELTPIGEIVVILDSFLTLMEQFAKVSGVPSGRVVTPGKPGVPQ